MAVVLPPPVKAGDAVSVVAPASDVNWEILEKAVTVLRSWGLEPVVHPQVYERRGYTAGSDEERAQGIVDAFDDARTTAVICAKGGYGCTRLTAFLSAEKLGPHNVPRKRFFGFSDITAIHSAMRIAVPGYGRCLQIGRAKSSGGVVSGRLIGGNLTLMSSNVGTPWEEELKDCILLLEDVDEPLYKLDRMLTQLFTSKGGLSSVDRLAALVLGDFGDAFTSTSTKEVVGEDVEEHDVKSWFWLEQLGFLGDLPILIDVPVGHIENNRVLALGAFAEIDLIAGEIRPLL